MSNDVDADFARLHATAQMGASSFDASKRHPLFSTFHSYVLAHKYGKEDPQTYMRNPGLRSMDTRQATIEGMQKAGAGVRRYADMYRPSIPGPIPPMPGVNTTVPTPVTNPGAYSFTHREYSQRMSPPGAFS
jgi:hypothetical protein